MFHNMILIITKDQFERDKGIVRVTEKKTQRKLGDRMMR